MKRRAGQATKCPLPKRGLDDLLFVDFGDRGEGDGLPPLLLENMADQIVLVQSLHDDDNRAPRLVVEARIERAVEPFVGGGATAL